MEALAYQEYKQAYEQLLSTEDKVDRNELMGRINRFLEDYPKLAKTVDTNAPIQELSLVTILNKMVQVAVGIVDDVSAAISDSDHTDRTSFRRALIAAFTREDRRMYVGLFLIVLSFILYFIDSAA